MGIGRQEVLEKRFLGHPIVGFEKKRGREANKHATFPHFATIFFAVDKKMEKKKSIKLACIALINFSPFFLKKFFLYIFHYFSPLLQVSAGGPFPTNIRGKKMEEEEEELIKK